MHIQVDRPATLLKPLFVPQKLLMGPGPSNCPPRVLHAMSLPVLGHLHPECCSIMDEVKAGIQYAFQTKNALTLAVSTSGHGGMEASMSNLIESGNTVLIAVHGIWGQRAANMAQRYGADVRTINIPAGEYFCMKAIEAGLSQHRPVLFFITQGESSTGVHQPIEQLGLLCHKYNCLLVVDAVASLGGVPVYMDEWEIDVLYTGSQKVLGAPPGLAPISFSPRAIAKIESRTIPVPVFYWDMKILGDYWACFGKPRVYHHTIPVSLLYGLREALAIFVEEGINKCIARHQMCAKRLHNGLEKLGLEFFVEKEEARLPTVTTIKVPRGLDWRVIQKYAMKTYCLEISGGLGPTVGKVIRIGLMGYNATLEKVDLTLKVLQEALLHARRPHTNL
ncbi:Serine--pyruvate aminotransferase, mitochondrial [Cryptotermes secundus]|uniref:Alanine--glyoxylate aminotransferase n=1 Tax=Cryptotermes secundus TaxID=105785 RepID=A0A2J7QYG5_9NEOP|nr:serine--pyruvate aminotransferase, mitochondrial [Cryptotermes secundus]PNF33614.1 Serine--pyruvate aminotransferase, mitochondrial [Cryptotermes secundus]